MRRVLFVAEHATLAQVVRLLVLAKSLPADRYHVTFACASFDPFLFDGTTFSREAISSIPRAEVERAVERGSRIYDKATLRRYVDDDLRLLDRTRPDIVIGDLRWSLAISAPVRRVPYACFVNAYWSPLADRDGFPLPDHPIVRALGVEMASRYFPMALPSVFAHFAKPVNELRRERGLPEIGSLPDVVTFGDMTLFPDVPSLVPLRRSSVTSHYLGPVCWSPSVPLSERAAALGEKRPLVYVTLGSSGHARVLQDVLRGLARLDVDVLVATAGRVEAAERRGVVVERFVPGDVAARKAAVVVSNGGSSTGWQALREGTPLVGVPFNLDQYLATDAVDRAGAGKHVRAGQCTEAAVSSAVRRVLEDGRYRSAARRIADEMRDYDAPERLSAILTSALP